MQLRQKVHSNEQMNASEDCGGSSRAQHSQFGRSSSMAWARVVADEQMLPDGEAERPAHPRPEVTRAHCPSVPAETRRSITGPADDRQVDVPTVSRQ